MTSAARYRYVLPAGAPNSAALMPVIPITLSHANASLTVDGLLDTGAVVNVLPYSVGSRLGLDWGQCALPIVLTGNLANIPARGIALIAQVATFPPVLLAFAWAQTDSIQLILGQMNFFMEFDVCFFRAQEVLDVKPK